MRIALFHCTLHFEDCTDFPKHVGNFSFASRGIDSMCHTSFCPVFPLSLFLLTFSLFSCLLFHFLSFTTSVSFSSSHFL